jgi:hypothetical protein
MSVPFGYWRSRPQTLLCLSTRRENRPRVCRGFHDAVKVSVKRAFEAPADVTMGSVECPVPPRLRRCRVRWPLLASSGATPASEGECPFVSDPSGWDQLMNSWAARTCPTPGSASSAGPAGSPWIRRTSSGSMSASWLPRNRMRAVIDYIISTVIRCSTVAAAVVTMLSINASWVASGRPRSSARTCSGATTMRLLNSLMALVRLTKTAWRVANRALIASRSPPTRGLDWCPRANAVRAARTASNRSFLAPRARFRAPTSTTSSPARASSPAKPAAKLPVPPTAQTRRPGVLSYPVEHASVSWTVGRCLDVGGCRRWPYPAPPGRWCRGPDHLR